jgi:hypothetical protein
MSAAMPVLDEATHRYSLDGATVPGVTEILAPIANFQMVDANILNAAAAFGTAVHKACELDDRGDLDEPSLDPAIVPYLAAWRRFSQDHRVWWSLIEARVYNRQMGYAGTVDRFGTVDGEPAVVDLKTSIKLHPTVGPQLAAYLKAIPEAPVLTRRIGVLLRPTGDYQMQIYTSPMDWAVFASLVTLRSFCELRNITPNFQERTR